MPLHDLGRICIRYRAATGVGKHRHRSRVPCSRLANYTTSQLLDTIERCILFGLIMNKMAMALAVSGLCVRLGAQWLNYPAPGIPRTPDGKPNLAAPTPKTP